MLDNRVAIVGAGVWGLAFANHLANIGLQVKVWCRSSQQANAINSTRIHPLIPDVKLSENIEISNEIETVVRNANEIICMIPSSAFLTFLEIIKPHVNPKQIIAWGCKGWVKNHSSIYFHEVAAEILGPEYNFACISGPSFAQELAAAKPTAIVVTSDNINIAKNISQRFHGGNLRCYHNSSMATVQFCGVYKNIIAVAAGISDGLNLGANARSALITRGIAEMQRVISSLKLDASAIYGLTGVGDVILSATSDLSRNRRLGLNLGKGLKISEIVKLPGMSTIESLNNIDIMLEIAKSNMVELPIAESLKRVLLGTGPEIALQELLARQAVPE